MPTLKDILEQLVRPGRDPRADTPAPILRSDVLKAEDLVTGMQLKGTVRNVVDFGAFVDIGSKAMVSCTRVKFRTAPSSKSATSSMWKSKRSKPSADALVWVG